jgi:hypothetical protein
LNYYFGTIVHTVTQSFSDAGFSNSEVIRTNSLHGVGWRLGATYRGLKSVFRLPETHSFNVAAVFSTTSWLTYSVERVQTYTTGILSPPDTTTVPDVKFRLPMSLAAGISYSNEKLLLAADIYYQPWSQATLDGGSIKELRDHIRVGGGIELLPGRDPGATFVQRVAYRLGAYYDATYYQISGQPINEWGITGGAGIPVWQETRLGVAAQYGWRGTTEYQLQLDRILRVSLSLSIGEPWFVRPPEE